MPNITVSHLSKHYQTHRKEAGFIGSIKSLFARQYETVKAVENVSFTIEEGELVGFIGPNGAGKTTTLKCLSGLLYPDSGTISVLGFNPFARKTDFLKQIALVMGQKNQLWWDLPVIETLVLNKEIYEVDDAQFKKVVNQLSTLLDVDRLLDIQVKKLSLGERMKCELIAALIHSPKVLFLDEPTIGLDVVMQQNLREFIKEYNKKFTATILLTSHYMRDVEALCERVIIIDHGNILYDGKLSEIVKKYAKRKVISVTFQQSIDKEKLERLGQVTSYEFPKATLSVERENSNHVAATLLEEFNVEDLNIEETHIEEVIRQVFKEKRA